MILFHYHFLEFKFVLSNESVLYALIDVPHVRSLSVFEAFQVLQGLV